MLRPGFWLLAGLLVAADLWSKDWAWELVARHLSATGEAVVPVAGEWLGIRTVRNPGGIFGLGRNLTELLTGVRLAAVGVILWLAAQQPAGNRLGRFTLALLLAGAAGNLYDNLSRWAPWPGDGRVRDFIQVDLGFWPFDPWPIFNLADSCISIGFLLLISGLARIQVRRSGAS